MFVKICGTTSEEDALLAVAMGADALGFIFAPSTRQVTTSAVADIVKRLPPEILTVAVFRNQSPERVVDTVHATGVKAVQLSGDETPDMVSWIRKRGVHMVIKGMAAGAANVPRAKSYGADLILLDNESPGSGQVYDWKLAEGVPPGQKFLLAGGLTPENVADAIAQANPWGVDAATGVEAEPGRKDARKLRAFISAAKAASRAEYQGEDRGPYDWQDDGA
jgi:phosphoribosylanthranilate isomerase